LGKCVRAEIKKYAFARIYPKNGPFLCRRKVEMTPGAVAVHPIKNFAVPVSPLKNKSRRLNLSQNSFLARPLWDIVLLRDNPEEAPDRCLLSPGVDAGAIARQLHCWTERP
jgi:hypothetical protein